MKNEKDTAIPWSLNCEYREQPVAVRTSESFVSAKSSDFSKPLITDPSEFDHYYFPEWDRRDGFFQENCFKCTCRNVFLFILLSGSVIGVCAFFIWFYWNDFSKNWIQYLKLASIPFVCVLFTYGHIALALWMTFNPVEFFGLYQIKSGYFKGIGIGWQGIVPMRAPLMADIAVDLMVPHVIRVEDVIEKLDPLFLARISEPALRIILEDIVPNVGMSAIPNVWGLVPQAVQDSVLERAIADTPGAVKEMIEDMKAKINEVFDLKDMARQALIREPGLLNDVFLTVGAKEFVFIRNFGAFLGLVLGLMQMSANILLSGNYWFDHLMLPISGFVLGWLTNWIAIKLIFRPIYPIHCCCGFVFQGLFLKRQKEVSSEFSRILTKRVLHARYIIEAMFRGKSSDKLFMLIQKHIENACDRVSGGESIRPIVDFMMGSEEYEKVKMEIVEEMFEAPKKYEAEFEILQTKIYEYGDEVMDIRETLKTKMCALPPNEFEGVLHPVFEQDEIKLIALGGFLGLAVGFFQVYVIGN